MTSGPESLGKEGLQAVLKEQPNDVQALIRLAEQHEAAGDAKQAAEQFNKVFKLNPNLLPVVLKLAHLHHGSLKEPAKAMEFAKRARQLAPYDAAVAADLGRMAFQAGDFPWSYSLLQESSRARTDDGAVLHAFAWAAYSVGRVGEAQEAMKRVLTLSGTDQVAADARRFLELTTADESKPETSGRVAAVLQEQPDYVPALMAKAATDAKAERAGAIGIYERVIQKWPQFAPAQARLAALYAEDPANGEKAHALAVAARKTLPDDPELMETIARLSYDRKEYRRVVQLLQDSERTRPLKAPALFRLGMAQLKLNEANAARASLEKALAANLADPEATEAQQALRELGSR